MRRILCAPDKFKGTLTASAAARAMCRGVERVAALTSGGRAGAVVGEACPVADGGDGTLEVIAGALGAEVRTARVTGPLGDQVEARFAINPATTPAPAPGSGAPGRGAPGSGLHGTVGMVELAQAAGLVLVPAGKRDPRRTTTFGVGELVRHAIDAGADEIIVAVGGSATVDGGCGIAQALGAKFFDRNGALIEERMTGGLLERVARVEPARGLPRIRVACDVDNPLLGPMGAARTYGPQKGATTEQVEQLERGLAHLAAVTGGDVEQSGAGAAGGAAFGLASLCGAMLERGIDLVLDVVRFRERCKGCDLVLTGEGRLDGQSLHGKACIGVARAALELGVPTVAIVGSTGPGAEDCTDPLKGGYLRSFVSLVDEFGEERALRDTAAVVEQAAERVVARERFRMR